MENKLLYPAVFHHAEEGGFWITFPDFPEAVSEGEDLKDAYLMACDCLNTILSYRIKENLDIPSPSCFSSISVKPKDVVILIEFDTVAFKRRINSKAIKKTLSIPSWLNEEAMAKNINFSQVLQEALLEKIKL